MIHNRGYVSEKSRQRVEEAIEETGFQIKSGGAKSAAAAVAYYRSHLDRPVTQIRSLQGLKLALKKLLLNVIIA